jgi:cell wall-associated NlpC family hydrolase
MHKTAIALLVIAIAAGCSMKPAPIYRDQTSSLEARLPRVSRDQLLNELSLYHGARYEEGGSSLSGIDCSGLVQVVFAALGVKLPRMASGQFGHGMALSRKNVRTGDLIFFGEGGPPSHVGIAVSDTDMIHASSSRGVVLEGIDDFSRYMPVVGIRRIVRLN